MILFLQIWVAIGAAAFVAHSIKRWSRGDVERLAREGVEKYGAEPSQIPGMFLFVLTLTLGRCLLQGPFAWSMVFGMKD